jgi:hypothetical protein
MAFNVTESFTWTAGDLVTAARLNSARTVADNQSYGFADGAAGTPSIYHQGDTNTGVYFPAADQVAVALGGTQVAHFTGSQHLQALGTVGAPAYSFIGDMDTGLYASAADQVSVSIAGTRVALFSAAQVHIPAGGSGSPGLCVLGSASTGLCSLAANSISITSNAAERMRFDAAGNVSMGIGAIATTATDGFFYVPTCAGTPTGTPTTYAGRIPIVIDSTNNKLYFYSGGAWRDAGP